MNVQEPYRAVPAGALDLLVQKHWESIAYGKVMPYSVTVIAYYLHG